MIFGIFVAGRNSFYSGSAEKSEKSRLPFFAPKAVSGEDDAVIEMESAAERAAAIKWFISENSFPEAVLYHIFKIYANIGADELFMNF